MSVDTDSHGEKNEGARDRPPAVCERLWALIPPARRAEFYRSAALGLVRGRHPETTVAAGLRSIGVSQAAIDAACRAEAPPASPEARPAAAAGRKRKPDRPAWPYGAAAPDDGAELPGAIAAEITAAGVDAATSARFETEILKAIAKDPSWVENHPDDLRILGCAVPPSVLRSVSGLVGAECHRVVEDIRARRAMGDVVAMRWMDPKDLSGLLRNL